MAAFLRNLFTTLIAAKRPTRKYRIYRLHLIGAGFAGTAAAVVFLLFYYLTLGLLPSAFDSWTAPHTLYPFSAWAYRLDLAQWIGSFIVPPWPRELTWWIGVIVFFGALAGGGVAYALLLSWDLARSSIGKGIGFGIALYLTVGMTMWVADGLQPAVMRNALPDVGFFFFGWTGWATLQMLGAFLLYGIVLGLVYRMIAQISTRLHV